MKSRRDKILWMKDLIEHMTRCNEQLQWASDQSTEIYLTETLMVDLSECQRLCQELKRPAGALCASAR